MLNSRPDPSSATSPYSVKQGTLDVLVLHALAAAGTQHGYAIARRIEQLTGGAAFGFQGVIYASLVRLEQQGWVVAEWRACGTTLRARFYSLTQGSLERLGHDRTDRKVGLAAQAVVSRETRLALIIWCALHVSAGGVNAAESKSTHLRPIDAEIEAAIAEGVAHSRTFRELVLAVERVNVITYLFRGRCAYPALACTSLLSGRSSTRYVRINIQLPGAGGTATAWGRRAIIALVGHELQHVLEIAADLTLTDEGSMRQRYERYGLRRAEGRYDSLAAVDVGDRIRAELVGGRQ